MIWLVGCAGAPVGTGDPAARLLAGPRAVLPSAALAPRPTVWPVVVVNEILPANDSISMDEGLDFDDWVELYNASPAAVDLGGWGLADDLGQADWTFPAGTLLDPGGHLVVWLDDEAAEGPLHANFSLDADGESVALFAPDGAIVDSWTFADQPSDVVLGRFPSGGPFRSSSIVATPANLNPVDPGLSRDPSDALFPDGGLIRVDLYLSPESEAGLAVDEAVVPAGLGFQGAYLNVDLAIKGAAGSQRTLDQKAAFRLNLDGVVPGQRLRGLEKLTLNNMVQDPSGVHELLAYALFRDAGVPAPRVAHVELYLNGAYRGLYLNVESPDDQFLQRWFADPTGNLYEGAYGADLTVPWSLELDEQGADEPTDRSELQPLVDVLAAPPTEDLRPSFDALVDLDRTLPMLAGEVALSHWDGYFYYPNNYRAYHEPATGRITLLPWGVDQTFGGAGDIHSPYGAVASWCLGVPSCRRDYDLALWELADRLAALDCADRVAEILPVILPLYTADPYREATPTDMESQANAAAAYCSDFSAALLDQLF